MTRISKNRNYFPVLISFDLPERCSWLTTIDLTTILILIKLYIRISMYLLYVAFHDLGSWIYYSAAPRGACL